MSGDKLRHDVYSEGIFLEINMSIIYLTGTRVEPVVIISGIQSVVKL